MYKNTLTVCTVHGIYNNYCVYNSYCVHQEQVKYQGLPVNLGSLLLN